METVTRPQNPALLVIRFQAVAEETRLAVIRLLSEGERCVCELQAELGAAQSRLSFHLRKLKDAGIIADRKDGRWVYYRLVPEALEEMREALETMTERADAVPGGEREARCCR